MIDETLEMMVSVAEQVVDHDQPFRKMRQRPLPGHRDATLGPTVTDLAARDRPPR